MQTELFRQQHKEILAIVSSLRKMCASPTKIDSSVGALIRSQLVSLSGKVMFHLSGEDRNLYPKLLAMTGTPPAKIAEAFSKEMGSLAGVFKQFISRWPTGDEITQKPEEFAQECLAVAKALVTRIEREEKELYPLLDAMG